MMNPPIADEVGQTARSVISVMKESPLSLALVVMNILLVAFLFYSNQSVLQQRQDALTRIVDWQRATDTLMANCVSLEVTKIVLENIQKTTETLLNAEQKEINRLQNVIREEREFNRTFLPNFPRPRQQDAPPPTSSDPGSTSR
jgi:hypothetical protein